MSKGKAWLMAARLRTLPLSVSGILVGSALALRAGVFRMDLLFMALITTILFQVLSNFANDYGDGVKGTDNEDRIGPKRAMQSGLLSAAELKKGMWVIAALGMLSAFILILMAFWPDHVSYIVVFLGLGLLSVLAAVKYTVGDSAYGYKGLGDLFVFLFFGLLAVLGTYFLYDQQLHWDDLLPASVIGFLSTGVLNLNNMRDQQGDAKAGKRTLVVKLGYAAARWYHTALILLALLFSLIWLRLNFEHLRQLIIILAFIPWIIHLIRVWKTEKPKELDPQLKVLALSTFFYSLLFMVSV